jgi:chemotaxis protein MotA
MKLILGILVVVGMVLGGFVLHHGNLMLLVVPTEYMIIGGSLLGSMIISNPMRVNFGILRGILGSLGGGSPGKKQYVELLQMIYELLQLARKEGVLALEGHVNEPDGSAIFTKYPRFLKDHHAVHFLCDTLKLFVAGALDAHAMDELMERDLEALHHEEMEPSEALQKGADALPALGIVACVLGIILTMNAISEGAAAVGQKVAGALVGTFFGVFLAYGFVGPMAGMLATKVSGKGRYYTCIRHVVHAAVAGVSPPMAVEIGRRSIYAADRPTFEELEAAIKEAKGS